MTKRERKKVAARRRQREAIERGLANAAGLNCEKPFDVALCVQVELDTWKDEEKRRREDPAAFARRPYLEMSREGQSGGQ